MAGNDFPFEVKVFNWSVVNFDMWPMHQKPIVSPTFSIDSVGCTKFCLLLYTRLIHKEEYVSVRLLRVLDIGPKYVPLQFEISLTDSTFATKGHSKVFSEKFEKGSLSEPSKFIRNTLIQVMSGDKAKLFLKCEYALDDDDGENLWDPKANDIENLSRDVFRALQESLHCDVQLKSSDGILFAAHKSVLHARFPDLIRKLNSDDLTDNELEVPVDSPTLYFLLRYLYSGKMDADKSSPNLHDELHSFKLPDLQQLLFPALSAEATETTIHTKRASFVWNIPRDLSKTTTLTKAFCFDELLKWTRIKLSIYKKNYLAKFSVQTMSSEVPVHIKCKIHVGCSDRVKECECDFQKEATWVTPFAINLAKINNEVNPINSDNLKVFFEFTISDGTYTSEVSSRETTQNRGTSNLWAFQEDFKNLYKNPKHSDVTIYVEDETVKAHKVILSARSPVFSKMFEHTMLEMKTGRVVVKDVTKAGLKAMLSYMYCGELEKPKDFNFVIDLYAAADMYQVSELKQKCVFYFTHAMDQNNVGALLFLATQHSDASLKKIVRDFVFCNTDEILNSHTWKQNIQELPGGSDEMQNINLAAKKLGPSIVMAMLSCLYCEGLDKENSIESTVRFYENAQKYNLRTLVDKCNIYFYEAIGIENIGKLVRLTNAYKDEVLEKCIEHFVDENLQKLLNSREWGKIRQEKPYLVMDMQNIHKFDLIINTSTVMGFLYFVYLENLGTKEKDLDSLIEFYSNTIEYKLNRMKSECISVFDRMISAGNVGKALELADQRNDESLLKCVKKFVSLNVKEILKADEWDRKMRERVDMAEDMQHAKDVAQELRPEILLYMLSYIYCGKLFKELDDGVYALYESATKYNFFHLVSECVSFFNQSISAENVGKLLSLSETHEDVSLKKHIQTFVSSNVSKILNSEEWRQIMKTRSELAEDMQTIAGAAVELCPTTFMMVLSYVYCGKIDTKNNDLDSLINFYSNTNKYSLTRMKSECISVLDRMLCAENIGKVLILADQNKDVSLLKCVKEFVTSHVKEILESEEWNRKVREKVDLAEDMKKATAAAQELGSEIVLNILSYVYCGKLYKEQDDIVYALYESAKEYKLFQLADKCVSFFSRIISDENVGKLLVLSETHDEALKKCIETFVFSNFHEILNSEEWRQKTETRPELAEDMERITIAAEELGPSIVITMLSFVYCGRLDKENRDIDSALKLYENAHKYRLPQIKKECISFLKTSMTFHVESTGKILKLADAFGDECLKTYVYDFVCCNAKEFLKSNEWRTFLAENPKVGQELTNAALTAIVEKGLTT